MPSGTSDDWVGTSGAWSVAGNWSLGPPGAGDNAVFSASIPIFVTFATIASIAALDDPGDPYAALDLTGGALSLTGGSWQGVFDQTGASLALGDGTFALDGPATLAGAISGPGTIGVTGTAEALAGLAISHGASLDISGRLATSGALTLGAATSDASAISVAGGGQFIIANPTTLYGDGTGGVFNSGLLEQITSGTSDIAANVSNSGTLAIAHGTLALYGGTDALAGTISGAGALVLFGGADATIGPGAVVTVATLEALNAGTSLTLGAGLAYAGDFVLGAGSGLALSGDTLTLSGISSLGGVISGPGVVSVTGAGDLNGLILSEATLTDAASLTEDGPVTLEGGATLAVASGASFDFLGNAAIGAAAGMGTITNAGSFAKTAGDGTSFVTADFINTGTLSAASGTLALSGGAASLGGALAGAGTLMFEGGASFTLDSGVVVSVADLATSGAGSEIALATSLSDAGGFSLGEGTTLALLSHDLTLSGADIALDGTLNGGTGSGGTLTLAGSADLAGLTVENGATIAVSGSASLDGPLSLGTASGGSELAVAAGGSLTIAAAAEIGGTGTLSNHGVITGWNGLGAATIAAALSNQGTLALDAGMLDVTGTAINGGQIALANGTLSIAGALAGTGTLSLGAAASAVLGGDTGTVDFTAAGAALTLDALSAVSATISGFAAGDTIDLANQEANGFSYGNGTLTLTDATNGGAASVVGALALPGLGATPALALANDGAGGTDILLSPPSPVFSFPANAITLDPWSWTGGGFASTPGANDDAIIADNGSTAETVTFANDTTVNGLSGGSLVTLLLGLGTLDVNGGLSWNGGLTLDGGALDLLSGGTIAGGFSLAAGNAATLGSGLLALDGADIAGTISGGGTLDFVSGGQTIEAGGAITNAAFDINDAATLATSLVYAGDFDLAAAATLALNGETLTLDGSATLAGTLAGPGEVIVAGTGDLLDSVIGNGAGLSDAGTIFDGGAITLGASGAGDLSIAGGALFDDLGDNAIAAGTSAAISNAGIFEKTGGAGTATIAATITSTGTILAADGALLFTGDGDFSGTLGGAGTIMLAGNATLGAGLAVSAGGFALDAGAAATLAGSLDLANSVTLAAEATLVNGSETLTLAGVGAAAATLDGTLSGAGAIDVTGSAIADGLTVSGSETIALSGTITQDGAIELGTGSSDQPLLAIQSGGVFAIAADVNINSAGTDAIDNAGLIEKTAGNGLSYLYGNLSNSGTIAVARGTLSLAAGAATLGGTLSGAGTLDLTAGAAATSGPAISFYTLTPGVALSLAGLGVFGAAELTDQAGGSYGGNFVLAAGGTLNSDATALTLSGAASLDGAISGAGTVVVSGVAEASGLAISGGAVLSDKGSLLLDGAASIGAASSTGQILVTSTGTLAITSDSAITGYNAGAISNAGLVEKRAGLGVSSLSGGIANTGTLLAASGTIDITGTLTNNALIEAAGGTIVLAGALAASGAATGTADIGAGGGIVLDGALASSQSVDFTASSGALDIADPGQFFGTIEGFASGDVIDLSNAAFTAGADTLSFASHTLSVSQSGTAIASLALAGSYSTSAFQLSGDGAGGTDITLTLPCFAAGTRIDTKAGPVPVEALAVGDIVSLARGGEARIVWIGWRDVDCRRHKHRARVQPVRVAAHAFTAGVPRRDVVLSPDHAVFADGVLVPVKFLVNGRTIREETADFVRYFHIELARHDLLSSEGLAVESYLDTGNRADFANAATAPERRRADTTRCAPLCRSGKKLAALHGRLARRALAGVVPDEVRGTQSATAAMARSPAASTARKSQGASATQPAVGAKSGVATWRKIAEPRPRSGGSSFQPSTPTMS